jgi:hypothetical protein
MAVNSGLKNEAKISELLVKGSEAITTKNDFGVHIFSGSVADDGIISGKLQKPKYDIAEIQKTVDIVITELLPPEVPEVPDTVLRSVYNPVTQSVIDLTFQVERLNTLVTNLNSKVSGLQIVSQSLREEMDSKELVVASAQNQTTQANSKIATTVTELQKAIQKATNEALQRVSLFARNQALLKENEDLKEQLTGKTAKIAEGAKVGKEFSVKVIAKADPKYADLTFNSRYDANGQGNWVNGPDIELYNFTKDAVTLTFFTSGPAADVIYAPTSVTLQSQETKIISIKPKPGPVADKPPTRIGQGDTLYTAALTIKSKTSTVTLSVNLQKQYGNAFGD